MEGKNIINLIFCTVGTSSLDPKKYQIQDIKKKLENTNKIKNRESYFKSLLNDKSFIEEIVEQQSEYYKKDDYKSLSAELASLKLFEKKKDKATENKVFLLGTDTPDGKLSLLLNKKVIQDNKENLTELWCESISDLKITDKKTFLSGINNTVNRICDIYTDEVKKKSKKTEIHTYLNITAGYKGLIPLLSLISYTLSFNIFYKFENSEELIWISSPTDVIISMPPGGDPLRSSFKRIKKIKGK